MWIDRYVRRAERVGEVCVQEKDSNNEGFESMRYPFTLLPLPYEHEALEPFIDERTMYLHHDRHLRGYIDKLNETLKSHPAYHSWTLTRLLRRVDELPYELRTAVRHNAGGVYNHFMYFEGMCPEPAPINAALLDVLSDQFGSVDAFTAQLTAAATDVFGSGYAWLCIGKDSGLFITATQNQDNPLSDGAYPLIALDVWEHAYYLKHYNDRAAYIAAFLRVLDYETLVRRIADWAKFTE